MRATKPYTHRMSFYGLFSLAASNDWGISISAIWGRHEMAKRCWPKIPVEGEEPHPSMSTLEHSIQGRRARTRWAAVSGDDAPRTRTSDKQVTSPAALMRSEHRMSTGIWLTQHGELETEWRLSAHQFFIEGSGARALSPPLPAHRVLAGRRPEKLRSLGREVGPREHFPVTEDARSPAMLSGPDVFDGKSEDERSAKCQEMPIRRLQLASVRELAEAEARYLAGEGTSLYNIRWGASS